MPADAQTDVSRRLTSAPEIRDDLMAANVGDEMVVFDPQTQQMHRLDPMAALVWQLLDGTASVDQTCREISEELGVDVERVRVDITTLVADLEQRHLLVGTLPTNGIEKTAAADEHGYWVSMPMTGCVASVTSLGWSDLIGIDVAGRGIGIRTNTPALAQQVRELFGSHVVGDTDDAFPNISLRAPEAEGEGKKDLGRLYTRCTLVGRSANLDELLARMLREVDGVVAPFASDAMRIHGAILEVDGVGAVMAPEPAWTRLVPHERSLAQDGIRLIARDGVLDANGTVHIPPTRIQPSAAAGSAGPLAALGQELTLKLRGWLLETGEPAGLAIAPGRGAMLAQAAIVNASLLDPQETLQGLTRVMESTPLVTYIGEWRSIAENVRACVTRV